MKISSKMNLDELAKLVGADVPRAQLNDIRSRLVLVWADQDTEALGASDWAAVLDMGRIKMQPIVYDNGQRQYYFHFNRRTEQLLGSDIFSAPARSGDRSVDQCWVHFDVPAPDHATAERWVRAYIAHPKAKYTGMGIQIAYGVGWNMQSMERLQLDPEVGVVVAGAAAVQ